MRKNKDMLRGFVLGVLLTAMIAAVPAVGAAATKRTIDVVYNDIKLVIDGKEVTPLDANGNVVEPFAYNGTTYLPLRACANALTNGTKPVSWDQETFTVYIGDRPVEPQKQVNMADLHLLFRTDAKFYVREQLYTPFNMLQQDATIDLLLKGDYETLEGMVAAIDTVRYTGRIKITDVDTGAVLFEMEPKQLEDPVPITVNVTGVDKLRIDVTNGTRLFNATMTTISRG